ncbi:MAG TPA: hypothetical protein VEU47_09870 [Candidatus Cybelea sp.]|nr:hypothetical protein [Candidatus Cybelea sp.]
MSSRTANALAALNPEIAPEAAPPVDRDTALAMAVECTLATSMVLGERPSLPPPPKPWPAWLKQEPAEIAAAAIPGAPRKVVRRIRYKFSIQPDTWE